MCTVSIKTSFFFYLNIIKEMKYNTSLSTGSHRFRKKKEAISATLKNMNCMA